MNDPHLDELIRQCASATQLSRLAVVEQEVVFNWLLDGGHMTRTGKPLNRPLPHPHVIGRKTDGSPIYAANADFSTHEQVTMPASGDKLAAK
jgi:hypothetical protein